MQLEIITNKKSCKFTIKPKWNWMENKINIMIEYI